MKEDTKTTCTPCEQNFERKVDELVKEGKAPTAREREEKEAEVEAAFSDRGKEKSNAVGCVCKEPATCEEQALLCVCPCYCCFL